MSFRVSQSAFSVHAMSTNLTRIGSDAQPIFNKLVSNSTRMLQGLALPTMGYLSLSRDGTAGKTDSGQPDLFHGRQCTKIREWVTPYQQQIGTLTRSHLTKAARRIEKRGWGTGCGAQDVLRRQPGLFQFSDLTMK